MRSEYIFENLCDIMIMVIESNYQALCWLKNTDQNTREADVLREYLKYVMERINLLITCEVFDIDTLEQTCGDTVSSIAEEIAQAKCEQND